MTLKGMHLMRDFLHQERRPQAHRAAVLPREADQQEQAAGLGLHAARVLKALHGPARPASGKPPVLLHSRSGHVQRNHSPPEIWDSSLLRGYLR